jgi:hypothetical protein
VLSADALEDMHAIRSAGGIMRVEDKIDWLLLSRAALKGVVAEVEEILGEIEGYPIALKALSAIDNIDRVLRDLRATEATNGMA